MDTIQNYKCPCCGAPLVFDAESQNLHCESCENNFQLETMQQMAIIKIRKILFIRYKLKIYNN